MYTIIISEISYLLGDACVGGKEWYFYSQRDRKYATGQRTNRATLTGYWKATGKDKHITQNGVLVGMRKTLVFYQGRAPKGTKTDWVMHEFRMESFDHASKFPQPKEDWVLCRVFYKDRGMAPTPDYSMANAMNYDDSMLVERYITFDGYDQVPCFSSSSLQNPTAAVERSAPAYREQGGMECFEQLNLNQVDDNSAIASVLNQLNRVDGKTRRDVCIGGLGEGNLGLMMLS